VTRPDWEAVKHELIGLLGLSPPEQSLVLARLRERSPALAAEVESLLSTSSSGDFLETPAAQYFKAAGVSDTADAAADAPPPARIGPWRLEQEIGRGGMGTVYRARRDDGAFEQTVAVKLVRPELSSEMLRRRFLAERRILASLEHPNIARVLDGGATDDGVPFLVLEYVAGEPVDVYADSRALSIEQRLRLVTRVCGAVHHAHQKLVLHRDIKAANVLVDENGEPKLLDFGIAKLLTPEPAEVDLTLLGFGGPLTPEWASPEQLRGEPLTTASDVYSLGVLLYVLLSGRRPKRYGGESAASFAAAIAASPAPTLVPAGGAEAAPGVERRRLRGDLDRIVRKALDPEPGRRYAAASELAADLERFLHGLPVEAHPYALGYRLRKWLERHRTAAAATLLVAASLVAATGFSLRQAQIADRERARAQGRFDDVRRLANVVLFDVQDVLVNVSGALEARRLLVENALRYLDDLAREAGDEPELLAELATAYERIGELQGMPEWPGQGRTGDARASLDQALALRRQAERAGAPKEATQEAEALLLTRLGSVFAARGETAEALARHREAAALLEALVARSPTLTRRLGLAIAQVAVGDDVWELGDIAGAATHYEAARETARAARVAAPESTPAARQVGVVEQRLGDAAAELEDWRRALVHHRASLEVDEELLRREPENAELQRDLGTDLARVGADAFAARDFAVALAAHQRARDLRERLLATEPDDARAIDDAAESSFHVARSLSALGRPREARRLVGLALERWRNLVATDAANVHWQDSLAQGLTDAARWEVRAGARATALALLGEAVVLRAALEASHPGFGENGARLAEARLLLDALRADRALPAPDEAGRFPSADPSGAGTARS